MLTINKSSIYRLMVCCAACVCVCACARVRSDNFDRKCLRYVSMSAAFQIHGDIVLRHCIWFHSDIVTLNVSFIYLLFSFALCVVDHFRIEINVFHFICYWAFNSTFNLHLWVFILVQYSLDIVQYSLLSLNRMYGHGAHIAQYVCVHVSDTRTYLHWSCANQCARVEWIFIFFPFRLACPVPVFTIHVT